MTVFVKQYGLERTGTNAVRALLERHVPDTAVLMHLLGDKHSAPVDLAAVLGATADARDPAREFALRASRAAPALTTRLPHDGEQLRHLEAVAAALAQAARAGELRVVVSVREPRAWVRAMLLWHASRQPHYVPLREAVLELVAGFCDRYNRLNAVWLELLERSSQQGGALVAHEELRGDLDALLDRLVRELRLPAAPPRGAALPRALGQAGWDHEPTPDAEEDDAERRRRAAALPRLPDALLDLLERRIDWELAARLGYPREPRPAA